LQVPSEHEQRAVYVVNGELTVEGGKISEGRLAVLAAGGKIDLHAAVATRAMLFGGSRFATPRHIWWNFVASSQERIDRAKQRWADGQFAPVPGETEFIPLPAS
jgi:hypothetical protein